MLESGTSFSNISFGKELLIPQEEMLALEQKRKKLVIGIPKENQELENRVPLTPEAVEILVNMGHEVIIESDSGKGSNYSNTDYSECGGFISSKKEEIFQSDIILKIAPLTQEEIEVIKGNQLVISTIHFNQSTGEYIKQLMKKKVTAIAFENIKDEHKCFPIERSMNTISGYGAIMVAAEYLSNAQKGKGVMLGGITGITPAEIVILGAGTASEFAARAAIGLGASVKVFDDSIYRLRRLQDLLGNNLYTSIFHPRVLEKALRSADVVIGALYQVDRIKHFYVPEKMIKAMKKGSVIIDIAIDQGGCFETSEARTSKDPVYSKHGILHYCVPNLPSRVSRTASIALSNILGPLLTKMGDLGGSKNHLKIDAGLRHGVYIYNGILTNAHIGNFYNIPSQNIDLLLAAF